MMESSHYRKIELQSPADFTYLHANAVALSRQKLDLHLPPSANPNDGPDPMRERVRELVDEFINRTFSSASASVSINGLDSSSPEFPFPASFTAPSETVEYEPYDTRLAARVTSLYAQLESLTTTVAQLRRDAPGRAAQQYVERLNKAIEEEDVDEDYDNDDNEAESEEDIEQDLHSHSHEEGAQKTDVDMPDASAQSKQPPSTSSTGFETGRRRSLRKREGEVEGKKEPDRRKNKSNTKKRKKLDLWNLNISLGTEQEAKRWRNGDVAAVYEDALRTLLHLQGEAVPGDNVDSTVGAVDGNALATTVGKSERAGRAVEFVEKI